MDEPLLTVVKGDPTPEELAAVVSAVAAKLAATRSSTGPAGSAGSAGSAVSTASGRQPRSGWAAYWRNARQPLQPGPGAWRRSALPGPGSQSG